MALSELAPDDRSVLALHYLGGLNSREIGVILGLTAEGIRTRKARILRHLREKLS